VTHCKRQKIPDNTSYVEYHQGEIALSMSKKEDYKNARPPPREGVFRTSAVNAPR